MPSQNTQSAASGQRPECTIRTSDWLAKELPPLAWTLGNRFAAGVVTIGGASEDHDLVLAIVACASALAIASGRSEITGEEVPRPGAVLWVTDRIERQLNNVVRLVMDARGVPDSAARVIFHHAGDTGLALSDKQCRDRFVALVRDQNVRHIIVEPLSLLYGVRNTVSCFEALRALRTICQAENLSADVLFGEPIDWEREGVPAFLLAADIFYSVEQMEDGALAAFQVKNAHVSVAQQRPGIFAPASAILH